MKKQTDLHGTEGNRRKKLNLKCHSMNKYSDIVKNGKQNEVINEFKKF